MTETSQANWPDIYEQSGYRLATLARMAKIDEGSFRKYLRGDRSPRASNNEKMVKVMKIARELERLQFHPSFGYATPEQIDKLKSLNVGAAMDKLLKEIEEQTRNRGKYK